MKLSITQSASKVKTAGSCSWKYHCSYNLKLPDKSNNGAKIGGIVHIILECLANPRRRKLVEEILKQKDPFEGESCRGIKALAYKQASLQKVDDDVSLEKIRVFTFNGLNHDFFGEARGNVVNAYTEKDFDEEELGRYKIRGFLDRIFEYEDGHFLIRDYKSSKETYKGGEATNENIQASMYALAIKRLFPHAKSVSVEFVFLKFDCNVESKWATGIYQGRETKKLYHNEGGKITLKYSWLEVEGFEYELEANQKYLEAFNEKTALTNLAANQKEPEDGSFGGPISCGFAKFPGQLKKDGAPMFYCSYKFAFEYFHILDEKGIFAASCFLEDEDLLVKKYPKNSYSWQKKSYAGCPAFKNFAKAS